VLTADLVRATVRKGVAHLRWIAPDDERLLAGASDMILAHESSLNHQAFVLDEAIAELTQTRSEPILWKGLAKLLLDRTTTETRAAAPPAEIRAAVFRSAGAAWPIGQPPATPRAVILERVAAELSLTVEQVESGLYADRAHEQWVTAFEPIDAPTLLRNYNVALAQAALLRAKEVEVELTELDAKRARALFRELKFRRLLTRVAPTNNGWKLTLDGPLSLFKQTSRYGLQLALLLPALVRCTRWTLAAEVTLAGPGKGRSARLELSQDSPLEVERKHLDDGTWISAEEEHFVRGFEALGSLWSLERGAALVDLDGRDVLLPDFVLRHADGREALLELVFAWRRAGFAKRLELLQRHGPPNLIVAFAEKGGLDAGDERAGLSALDAFGGLVRFKGVIPPKRVIEAAEACATQPPAAPAEPIDTRRKRALRPPRR